MAAWTYIHIHTLQKTLHFTQRHSRGDKAEVPSRHSVQSCMQQVNEPVYGRLGMCVCVCVTHRAGGRMCVGALTLRQACELPPTDGEENISVTFTASLPEETETISTFTAATV